MRYRAHTLCSALCSKTLLASALLGGSLLARPAAADTMVVLLDLSGSMTATRPNRDGRGATRFDAARYIAETRVSALKEGRVYGLWTFSGSGYRELVAPADYVDDAAGSQRAVLDAIAGLRSPAGGTPLAQALCDAVDMLRSDGFIRPFRPGAPDERPIIELVTDGEENSTPSSHPCHGPSASNAASPEAGTWQQKITSKAQTGSPALTQRVPPESAFVVVNANYLLAEAESVVRQKAMSDFTQSVAQKSGGNARTLSADSSLPQLGDVDGDGCVDDDDLDQLLEQFDSSVQRYGAGDLNGDGRVDSDDYLTLLQSFGEGCVRPLGAL